MSKINDLHSFGASIFRGIRGLIVIPYNQKNPPRPQQPLELYEFEACPYCRKVREVMSELDLSYINRTCAGGAKAKREALKERGGKVQFPYLVDPNMERELYESEAIIDYLHETYGAGKGRGTVSKALAGPNTFFAGLATMIRPRGRKVRAGLEERGQPAKTLVLYNFENSPYCRKVRECLNELNLDYQVENVAKKSQRRSQLVMRGGQLMVPFLIDANTGKEMYESDDIIAYLEKIYG